MMKTMQIYKKLSLETRIMIDGGLVSLGLMLFSFLAKDPLAFALGVIFGGAYSILNFRLMQLTFDKAMKMPSARAQKYVQTRYFLRYLITGVVIYVAIINPWVNIIGVLLGLVAVKISVLINTTVSKKNVLINEA
ncbi:ATP synthase subunit I [Acetobacterium sp.]|uniref:ATP synthase subunit I n=1 Tax=Acetobacterium sp. TaxID=1872094 RepID=UPI002723D773|nr:ATP synthase subunit I [Acetobacterium sp.]MDO9493588.1 ATP synthase subunit I [Acetobacterium sp.]